MAFPPDQLDTFPALKAEQITPTGVAVVGMIHENLTLNFRKDLDPDLDLPSIWRLAKHVVTERGPLVVFRYKNPNESSAL